MADEAEKPQKIPSWKDPGVRPKAKPTSSLPTSPAYRASGGRQQTSTGFIPTGPRSQQYGVGYIPSRGMGASQHGFRQQSATSTAGFANSQYQMDPFSPNPLYMPPGFHEMGSSLIQTNNQLMALLKASSDAAQGIAVPPLNEWGHLNPYFNIGNFGGSQIGNYAQTQHKTHTNGQGFAFNSAQPDISTPSAIPGPPIGLSLAPPIQHIANTTSQPISAIAKPRIGHDSSTHLLGDGGPKLSNPSTPSGHMLFSQEENDTLCARIFDDLSDDKKRDSYLPHRKDEDENDESQESQQLTRNIKPEGSRQESKQKQAKGKPSFAGTEWSPPKAPRAMLEYARDISQSPSSRGRGVGVSSAGRFAGNEEDMTHQLRPMLPLSPPKTVRTPGQPHRDTGDDVGLQILGGTFHVGESEVGERQTMIGHSVLTPEDEYVQGLDSRGSLDASEGDRSLTGHQNIMEGLSSRKPSLSLSKTYWNLLPVPKPSDTPNPFLTLDHNRLDPGTADIRRHQEELLQYRWMSKFRRLTQTEYYKKPFKSSGGTEMEWRAEKSRLLVEFAEEHYENRVALEKKHQEEDRAIEKSTIDQIITGFGFDINDLTADLGLLTWKAQVHRKDGTHLILTNSALRKRQAEEIEGLDHGTTYQERADLLRRLEDEWSEWNAALPLRDLDWGTGENVAAAAVNSTRHRSAGSINTTRVIDGLRVEQDANCLPQSGKAAAVPYTLMSYGEILSRHARQVASLGPKPPKGSKKEIIRRQKGEMVEWHAHDAALLRRGTTPQEQKEVFRRKILEIAEWHASQGRDRRASVKEERKSAIEFIRRRTLARSSTLGVPDCEALKRKAVENIEDEVGGGGRKRVCHTSGTIANGTEPAGLLNVSSTFGVNMPGSATKHAPAIDARDFFENPNTTQAKSTNVLDLAGQVDKGAEEEFDRIFKLIRESGVLRRDESSGKIKVIVEHLSDEMQIDGPQHSLDHADGTLAVQTLGQASRVSQVSDSVQAREVSQASGVSSAPSRSSSPPIPQGEWILDSVLDSLLGIATSDRAS